MSSPDKCKDALDNVRGGGAHFIDLGLGGVFLISHELFLDER